MLINLKIYDDRENFIEDYDYDNPLELVEKAIELFKETGGKVRYKVPERGEKLISNTTGELLEADDIYNPSGSDRLTFTPPKPEPVESDWEKFREGIRSDIGIIMDKIDDLDRRCSAGGGKDGK